RPTHDLEEKKQALATRCQDWAGYRRQLEGTAADEEQLNRELAFLQYEIDEIAQARLRPGEDEQLESDFRRLSHGRKILETLAECRELCSDGSGSVSDSSGRAVRALLHVSEYDEQVCALADQLQEIDSLINDFNRDLCGYMDEFEYSEELFSEVESRLDQINHLKSKYGKTIEHILLEKEKKEAEAEKLLHYDEYRRDLEEKLTESERALREISAEVSDIRKSAAAVFADELKNALSSLNFLDVRLELEFQKLDHYSENGWDDVRFLISTNPGETLKPLDSVASGGELSRIMLALKTVLAENDEIETLIFDEIDSGISGRTAQMVAEKIRETGRNHQVICITHLPQIASMADSHFLIEKTPEESSAVTRIRLLDREESIRELARMLGGREITESVLQTAREMKELAGKQ
ncbi:MAG: DNA repair protein RecN, partial [Lachnospiraceae bacterium]|nr:DNA repair protein RecN [Lachnospiraceae bacterium]